jgi:hypothetical protein
MSRLVVQAISVFMTFVILAPSAVSSQQGLTTTQWRDDLNFMVSHMEKIHPVLFANVEETAFRRAAKELSDSLADMSDYEIIVDLLRLAAMLEDGHTRLHGNKLSDYWFPIRIEEFVDGLYITAVSKEHSDLLGRLVIEIAGRPAKDVFEAVKAITPHDNEYSQIYTASLYLTMASTLSGLGLIEDSRKLTLTTMNPDAGKEMRTVRAREFASDQDMSWFWLLNSVPVVDGLRIWDGHTSDELPLYLQNVDKPYWFHHLEDESTVYVGFNLCAENPEEPFADFNTNLWKLVEKEDVHYVVVDLRHNIGGTNSFVLPFVHEAIRHPMISGNGNLFVIIGRKTWSAAVHLATWLDFHVDPTFVGEPTGSGPNHYADPEALTLPNSQILLLVSRLYWQNSWPWDDRRWIAPDVPVEYTSDQYFDLSDPAMDRIRAIIEHNGVPRNQE